MCGIAGIVRMAREHAVPQERIEYMCAQIAHRGPDDHGSFIAAGVGLGHRRLSILDPEHGHQPMGLADAQIVFNGEIYNHMLLRSSLAAAGARFTTHCDTETILHLMARGGLSSLGRLNGMFAFGLWRESERTLTLVRDSVGIKPLYYGVTPAGDIVFASEIKAIFASGLLPVELDETTVAEHLAFGHVSGNRTLFRGVRKLMPGTSLTWRNGQVDIQPYRTAEMEAEGPPAPVHMGAASDTFWELFRGAVERQLLSDVPLGLFLSGGLDSSLILAAMREVGVARPQSYSVGFLDSPESELGHAKAVAGLLGSEHHECTVDERAFFDLLGPLTWQRDLPLTFAASIPLYVVAAEAAKSVKVVLTGEGSDELFAGYGRYPRALWNMRAAHALGRAAPYSLREGAGNLLARHRGSVTVDRLFRSGLVRRATIQHAYLDSFAMIDSDYLDRLMGPGQMRQLPESIQSIVADQEAQDMPMLERLLRLDQATYLEELLMKQDTMSMAASLESRVPFLDNVLVAWSRRVPIRLKLSGARGKQLVRKAAERRLPRAVTHAPKRGFPVPTGTWMRRGIGQEVVRSLAILPGDPLLSPKVITNMIQEHEGGRDHASRLWQVLAFQVWRREVVPRMQQVASR